jgi:2-iminobutanoate/2-iminopropanoate deaminase
MHDMSQRPRTAGTDTQRQRHPSAPERDHPRRGDGSGDPTATREVIAGSETSTAIGPYSPAVRAGGFLFVSGQPGVDPESAQPAGATFRDQTRQALRNLDAVLRAAGSRPELVVSTTVLVADASDFGELNELYAEYFPSQPPARMTMQVPLPRGLLISIGCIALAP